VAFSLIQSLQGKQQCRAAIINTLQMQETLNAELSTANIQFS
jgi:hypothetical protein